MSWRTAAAVLIVVFAIAVVQAALAGPFTSVQTSLNQTGDYGDLEGAGPDYDGNDIITSLIGDWFNMGLVAMFGAMVWGVWRVVRREITRGGGGL